MGERLLDSEGQDKQEVKTTTTSVNGSASIGGGLTSTFTIRKEVDYATTIRTLCVLVGGEGVVCQIFTHSPPYF